MLLPYVNPVHALPRLAARCSRRYHGAVPAMWKLSRTSPQGKDRDTKPTRA